MSTVTTTSCDNCGRGLSEGGSMPTFRLALTAEALRNSTGFRNAVHVDPPIDGTKHFCNRACLCNWLTRQASAAA